MMNDKRQDDRFARESFTFRRMRPWQIWTLLAALVILIILYFTAV